MSRRFNEEGRKLLYTISSNHTSLADIFDLRYYSLNRALNRSGQVDDDNLRDMIETINNTPLEGKKFKLNYSDHTEDVPRESRKTGSPQLSEGNHFLSAAASNSGNLTVMALGRGPIDNPPETDDGQQQECHKTTSSLELPDFTLRPPPEQMVAGTAEDSPTPTGGIRRRFTRRAMLTTTLTAGGLALWSTRSRPTLHADDIQFEISVIQAGGLFPLALAEARLPLVPGDGLRIEASAPFSVYWYLLWLDAAGNVDPVWPWKTGDWSDRLDERDKPLRHICLPQPKQMELAERRSLSFTLQPDESGLQAILLFVRRERLPGHVDLRNVVQPLPHSFHASTLLADKARFFPRRPGERIERFPIVDDQVKTVNDPNEMLNRLIQSHVDNHAEVACAALFPFNGTNASSAPLERIANED